MDQSSESVDQFQELGTECRIGSTDNVRRQDSRDSSRKWQTLIGCNLVFSSQHTSYLDRDPAKRVKWQWKWWIYKQKQWIFALPLFDTQDLWLEPEFYRHSGSVDCTGWSIPRTRHGVQKRSWEINANDKNFLLASVADRVQSCFSSRNASYLNRDPAKTVKQQLKCWIINKSNAFSLYLSSHGTCGSSCFTDTVDRWIDSKN